MRRVRRGVGIIGGGDVCEVHFETSVQAKVERLLHLKCNMRSLSAVLHVMLYLSGTRLPHTDPQTPSSAHFNSSLREITSAVTTIRN